MYSKHSAIYGWPFSNITNMKIIKAEPTRVYFLIGFALLLSHCQKIPISGVSWHRVYLQTFMSSHVWWY